MRVYNGHSLQVSFSFVSLFSNARLTNQMKSKYTDPKLVVIDEGNNDEVCINGDNGIDTTTKMMRRTGKS